MKAFSLLELLVVVGFVAAISVVSMTSFLHWKTQEIRKNTLSRLTIMIEEAHQFATFYGDCIVICPKGNEDTCGHNWEAGQLVFIDKNHNHERDADEILLKVYPSLFPQESLMWEGFSGENFISFYPEIEEESSNGKFVYRSLNQVESSVEINLNRYGRIRQEEKTDGYAKKNRV